MPAIKLNNVVLPDPFGPIMPVIEPLFIFREHESTAAKPPKNFERLSIFKIFESGCIKNYTLFSLLRILLIDFSKTLKYPDFLNSLSPCQLRPPGV